MKGNYAVHSPSRSRAIYRDDSKLSWTVGLLIVTKGLHAVSLYAAYNTLLVTHVVQFVCLVKLFAGLAFVLIQKPFSSHTHLTEGEWFRICRHAFINTVLTLLWFYGLTLCGPLRTALVVEHYDFVIIAGLGAFVTGLSSPRKVRGMAFFTLGLVALLLFDHDDLRDSVPNRDHPEGQQHSGVSHLFFYLLAWMGLADHKGGVILLLLILLLQVGFNALSRRLAADIGGSRRLQSLSTLVSGIMLIPWTLVIYFTKSSVSNEASYLFLPAIYVAFASVVLNYIVDLHCIQRLDLPLTGRIGSLTVFLGSLVITLLVQSGSDPNILDHGLSGGVICSCLLFIFAVLSLTSVGRGNKGSFVGYSASGLPLYSFTTDTLQQTSQSLLLFVRSGIPQILGDPNSRKIFYFLCINLCFTFVEFLYGFWTNSLGLISDGFHMLFDCSALVIGLYAAVMARWKPSKTFSYGYSRVEILSGFVNGLFLLVIAIGVFTEGMSRLFDPPQINTDRLVVVSVAGLCVNIIGIFAFRNSSGHHHSHAHGHSHGVHSHSHTHGHSHNVNMEGVFLHVLADTLGSVGVILSSILIEQFGWLAADPICSLFIAVLIFLSVLPLVREASQILLLRTPSALNGKVEKALQDVMAMEGVTGYRDPHFWQHSADLVAGTIHVKISANASEQKIIHQVSGLFKSLGFHNFTVQVEKDLFFTHLSGLNFTGLGHTDKSVMGIHANSASVLVKAI